MVRAGLEPGISGSQGKRPNHWATLPPSVANAILVLLMINSFWPGVRCFCLGLPGFILLKIGLSVNVTVVMYDVLDDRQFRALEITISNGNRTE